MLIHRAAILLCRFALASAVLLGFGVANSDAGLISIDHLETPAAYDNAGAAEGNTSGHVFGQTFVAVHENIVGVRVYLGDPTRPGNTAVDQLTGSADLVLFTATDLNNAVELARQQVLAAGVDAFGLTAFLFDTPVPTTVGEKYFFGIDTADTYGLGLRSLSASTYTDGAEAFWSETTGGITAHASGRDVSFQLLASVPEPSTWRLLAGAVPLVIGRAVRLRGRRLTAEI